VRTLDGVHASLRSADKAFVAAQSFADVELKTFQGRLRAFRVFDTACGSGNFLYLPLVTLKNIERRVAEEAEVLGATRPSANHLEGLGAAGTDSDLQLPRGSASDSGVQGNFPTYRNNFRAASSGAHLCMGRCQNRRLMQRVLADQRAAMAVRHGGKG
jgi:hypothetical protein